MLQEHNQELTMFSDWRIIVEPTNYFHPPSKDTLQAEKATRQVNN